MGVRVQHATVAPGAEPGLVKDEFWITSVNGKKVRYIWGAATRPVQFDLCTSSHSPELEPLCRMMHVVVCIVVVAVVCYQLGRVQSMGCQ
jgi:hypothetical protein